MEKGYKIQILLSTYNGEKYIREQLDSYIALENYENVSVLIRDDGSTDKTLEILNEYREKHGFEVIFGENIGFNASMYEIMKHRDRECDYYAFSDQDDVWLKDKLVRAIDKLSCEDKSVPLMYAACSYLTDESLNITGCTLVPKKSLGFYNAMVQNVCPGHSQVINRALMDILSELYSDKIMVLDYWTYLLAGAVGRVVFEKTPSTLYRQHKTNAIGCEHSRLKVLKNRISRVRTKKSVLNAMQLKSMCEMAKDLIPEKYAVEAERFYKCQKNFFTRLSYVFSSKAYRQTAVETLIFKLMYLFGRYNI